MLQLFYVGRGEKIRRRVHFVLKVIEGDESGEIQIGLLSFQ